MEKSQKRILYWKIISLVVRPMRLQSWIDGMKIIQFLRLMMRQEFTSSPEAKLGGNFKQVGIFLQSGKQEDIVTLKMPASQKVLVRQHNWPERLQVRLVKVILPNGDPEVLITSLLDKTRFPAEDFGWVYQQRWGVETPFNFLKNQTRY